MRSSAKMATGHRAKPAGPAQRAIGIGGTLAIEHFPVNPVSNPLTLPIT